MGLFAATFGVAVYSDIDIISSMCMLMARGAVVSMVCVIFILPALLMLCDKIVCKTTLGGELRFDELRGLDRMVAKKMERTMAQNGVEPPHVLTHILEEFAKRMKAENR